jgi:hypothetical protein
MGECPAIGTPSGPRLSSKEDTYGERPLYPPPQGSPHAGAEPPQTSPLGSASREGEASFRPGGVRAEGHRGADAALDARSTLDVAWTRWRGP